MEEKLKSGKIKDYLTCMTQQQQKWLQIQRATNKQFINRLQDKKSLIESQPNFAEFYSNGPIKKYSFDKQKNQTADSSQLNMNLINPQKWITKEIEEKAAIIIQKWMKRHQQMKRFREMQKFIKENKQKKISKILKKWKNSKELMTFIKEKSSNIGRQKKYSIISQQSTKLSSQISQFQPSSPKGNLSSALNSSNIKQNAKDNGKDKRPKHQKRFSESQNHIINEIKQDNSDSISSINSKISRQSNIGSITSTKAGGTIIYDMSNQRSNSCGLNNKKIKSTNLSINKNTSSSKDIIDFQSPRSAVFQSRQILSPSSIINNFQSENIQSRKLKDQQESIIEDVQIENEQILFYNSQKSDGNALNQQNEKENNQQNSKSVGRKSITTNQLKYQIYTLYNGFQDFSRKREDIILKQKKLFYGAKSGNLQIIKSSGLIFYPIDVNLFDEKGNCPLYYVTKKGNEEFINYLLKLEADINLRCSEGNTPLHISFQLGNEKIILNFLDKGGDLNIVNNYGQTPLAFASLKLLKTLKLEKGITIVESSKIGQKIDFDNNQIFSDVHNEIDKSNYFKQSNSNTTIIKKRKEKKPEEEIPQEEIFFSFVPIISTLDQINYDKFTQGIKTQQKSIINGDFINKIQSFVEPLKRLNKRKSVESLSKITQIIE